MTLIIRHAKTKAKLDTAITALERIKYHEGKVCPQFEVCKHVACNSSYAAYAISDLALSTIDKEK